MMNLLTRFEGLYSNFGEIGNKNIHLYISNDANRFKMIKITHDKLQTEAEQFQFIQFTN